ncbi:hypothetical protein [Pantoea dispersa]|uniref:hypothetical protein n=1 Tax=Pantoea dispersa TaxID=59814 RepID=UPI001CA69AEB|nr:hypothetical protein [Pantoea dispersa]QZY97620.1 hypothetical protein K7X52_22955 [Pantoea dispersa]QZY97632.1 hypothetical protein K7X52_23055 [Pantoea dispersa]
MKHLTRLTLAAAVLLTGCATQPQYSHPLYLKTEMQSPVSVKAVITDSVLSYIKEDNVRHIRLYSLPPLPGKQFHDTLERKYNATTLYIDLVENNGGYKAEISGVINYYDTQRYVNGKLVGDVIESVPVPPVTVQLNSEKSVNIELPRGIRFTAQITDDDFSGLNNE